MSDGLINMPVRQEKSGEVRPGRNKRNRGKRSPDKEKETNLRPPQTKKKNIVGWTDGQREKRVKDGKFNINSPRIRWGNKKDDGKFSSLPFFLCRRRFDGQHPIYESYEGSC